MQSGKPIYVLRETLHYTLHPVPPSLPLEQVSCSSDLQYPFSSFQGIQSEVLLFFGGGRGGGGLGAGGGEKGG